MNQELGPFSSDQIQNLFVCGDILKKDEIRHSNTDRYITVKRFLVLNNLKLHQESEAASHVFTNFPRILKVLLNPFLYLKGGIKDNLVILYLLLIVLTPAILLVFSDTPLIVYLLIGVYFAFIWGIIIYKSIATEQVKISNTVIIALGTVITSFVFILLVEATSINEYFEILLESNSLVTVFIGMLFGVAIIEEACKQLFIYLTIKNSKTVLLTRTAIFYGMIAGLAFGIAEGVGYQLTINKELAIDQNYFLNILRLTSLPFFHAIWAGISAYCISMSYINLNYKNSLRLAGILIPSFLHAGYNIFGLSIIGILIIALSALILTAYLTKANLIIENLSRERS